MLYPDYQDNPPFLNLTTAILVITFIGFTLALLWAYDITPNQIINSAQYSWHQVFPPPSPDNLFN